MGRRHLRVSSTNLNTTNEYQIFNDAKLPADDLSRDSINLFSAGDIAIDVR